MTTKQVNIKQRTYYFYNDLINIKDFNKKLLMGLNIYYIGYVTKKSEWNVNSVNPLYLNINRFSGFIEERNRDNYLNISNTDKNTKVLKKYIEVWNGIKNYIRKINDSEGKYDNDFMKIKFNSYDDVPLNKKLYFPTIAIIVRNIFEKDGKYYPQCFLDECLYEV